MQSRTTRVGGVAAGNLLIAVAKLVIFGFLSRFLISGDYATYRQLILIFGFVSAFLGLGLPESLLYFLSKKESSSRAYLTVSLALLTATGILFTVAVSLFGGNVLLGRVFANQQVSHCLLSFSVFAALSLPYSSLGPILVANHASGKYLGLAMATAAMQVICVVGASWHYGTIAAALNGHLVAATASLAVGIPIVLRTCPGRLPSVRDLCRQALVQLRFGLPLSAAGLAGRLQTDVSFAIVAMNASAHQFACYANGAVEIPFVTIITGAVTPVVTADIAKYLHADQFDAALRVWQSAMVKCAVLLFPVMFFCLAASKDIVQLLFSEKYAESWVYFSLFLFLLPIRITNFGAVFIAAGRGYLLVMRTLFGAVVVALACIPSGFFWGPVGVAVSVVVATYVLIIPLNLFIVGSIFKTHVSRLVPYRVLIILGLATGLGAIPCVFALHLMTEFSPLFRLAIAMPLFLVSAFVTMTSFQIPAVTELSSEIRRRLFGAS